MVDQALGCNWRRCSLVDQTDDLDHTVTFANPGLDAIANPNGRGWFRRTAVDPHVTALACGDRQRARLDESHRPQPLIDSYRVDTASLSDSLPVVRDGTTSCDGVGYWRPCRSGSPDRTTTTRPCPAGSFLGAREVPTERARSARVAGTSHALAFRPIAACARRAGPALTARLRQRNDASPPVAMCSGYATSGPLALEAGTASRVAMDCSPRALW